MVIINIAYIDRSYFIALLLPLQTYSYLQYRVFQSCCDKSLGEILLAKSSKKFKRTCVRKCFVLEIQGVQISKIKYKFFNITQSAQDIFVVIFNSANLEVDNMNCVVMLFLKQ